ncbi:hypothetical protein GW17_00046541 [Ensete ventricosum]|nr:hypothetical protein GW17_00046541 [Ensete ventricosum]
MARGCIIVEATTNSSIEPSVHNRVSYTRSLFFTNDKLKSFRSFLMWMCVNQSDTRHVMVS